MISTDQELLRSLLSCSDHHPTVLDKSDGVITRDLAKTRRLAATTSAGYKFNYKLKRVYWIRQMGETIVQDARPGLPVLPVSLEWVKASTTSDFKYSWER